MDFFSSAIFFVRSLVKQVKYGRPAGMDRPSGPWSRDFWPAIQVDRLAHFQTSRPERERETAGLSAKVNTDSSPPPPARLLFIHLPPHVTPKKVVDGVDGRVDVWVDGGWLRDEQKKKSMKALDMTVFQCTCLLAVGMLHGQIRIGWERMKVTH